MKIRTITIGFNLKTPPREQQIEKMAEFSLRAKKSFQKSGYEVQTVRIVTQPWENYLESEHQIEELVKGLDTSLQAHGIDFFSIGTTYNPNHFHCCTRF